MQPLPSLAEKNRNYNLILISLRMTFLFEGEILQKILCVINLRILVFLEQFVMNLSA
jgi:hypothetical protein